MFSGRINKEQYRHSMLRLFLITTFAEIFFVVLAMLVVFAATPLLIIATESMQGDQLLSFLYAIVISFAGFLVIPFLVTLPFILSLHVRRLHDIGKSGWMVFLIVLAAVVTALAPFIGWLFSLALLYGLPLWTKSGKEGPNKFGEPTVYASIWSAVRGDMSVTGTSAKRTVWKPYAILVGAALIAGIVFMFSAGMQELEKRRTPVITGIVQTQDTEGFKRLPLVSISEGWSESEIKFDGFSSEKTFTKGSPIWDMENPGEGPSYDAELTTRASKVSPSITLDQSVQTKYGYYSNVATSALVILDKKGIRVEYDNEWEEESKTHNVRLIVRDGDWEYEIAAQVVKGMWPTYQEEIETIFQTAVLYDGEV